MSLRAFQWNDWGGSALTNHRLYNIQARFLNSIKSIIAEKGHRRDKRHGVRRCKKISEAGRETWLNPPVGARSTCRLAFQKFPLLNHATSREAAETKIISIAACHSAASCSAFGSFVMYLPASSRVTIWRPRGNGIGSSKGRFQPRSATSARRVWRHQLTPDGSADTFRRSRLCAERRVFATKICSCPIRPCRRVALVAWPGPTCVVR
jgi:hypothetical protein